MDRSQPIHPIHTIFLADDDEDDREVFGDVVHSIIPAAKIEIVNEGTSLLQLLQHFVPDLIFLYLEMPGKNGLQCLLEIRSNKGLQDIPIVVFSSTSRPVNIQTTYEMGADLFLIKDSSFRQYTKHLEMVLKMDWSNREGIKKEFFYEGHSTPFHEPDIGKEVG